MMHPSAVQYRWCTLEEISMPERQRSRPVMAFMWGHLSPWRDHGILLASQARC